MRGAISDGRPYRNSNQLVGRITTDKRACVYRHSFTWTKSRLFAEVLATRWFRLMGLPSNDQVQSSIVLIYRWILPFLEPPNCPQATPYVGYVEGVTHDYRRHGTTTLFAALDTAKGQVLAQCRPRHRHQEYQGFLREIEKNVPETLDVHIIVDNYATHKHPRVKRWLAARPRFHVHFTPTYASWLNQVEIWFNRITQQAIRRGTFRSVKELVEKIDQYVQTSNHHAQPFVWTATADSIFAKVQRLCERISGTGH